MDLIMSSLPTASDLSRQSAITGRYMQVKQSRLHTTALIFAVKYVCFNFTYNNLFAGD